MEETRLEMEFYRHGPLETLQAEIQDQEQSLARFCKAISWCS
jgi:hypothetical protein